MEVIALLIVILLEEILNVVAPVSLELTVPLGDVTPVLSVDPMVNANKFGVS